MAKLSPRPTRAPQQARSIRTRQQLVVAAAQTLVDRGYAGTSTMLVAERAGLSQGAVFKHFPVKQQLLAAAVAELLLRLSIRFQHELISLLGGESAWSVRIAPAAKVLWSIFRSPELRAVYEVYVAARTEPALDAELEEIVRAHRDRVHTLAELLFPELSTHPGFEDAIGTVIFAMQGASVGLFGTGVRNEAEVLAFFERLASRELSALAPITKQARRTSVRRAHQGEAPRKEPPR